MDNKHYVRELTAYAYPSAEPLDATGSRLLRRWVIRLLTPILTHEELSSESSKLVESAKRRLLEHYAGTVSESELQKVIPSVRLIRVDTLHIVAEIEFPGPGAALGDDALIANWGVLRDINAKWQIEDLEGIPCEYWLHLK